MTLFIIALWIICGISSAFIASEKNRDVGAWFLIGIVLGVFGLIMIAAVPSLPKEDPL